MDKIRLISYEDSKERMEFLKENISFLEEFLTGRVAEIFCEYLNEYYECANKGITMNYANKLELYYANLKYYYELI